MTQQVQTQPALPASDTRRPLAALVALLAAGLVVRILLFHWGSFQYDASVFRYWAARLVTAPLADFYDTPQIVDHLPGDLWVLWAVAHLYRLFSPGMHVESFRFLFVLKLVAALGDTAIGVMLYLIGRRLRDERTGLLAAALFVLNPASIYLTAIWGQWDSISGALVLGALWLYLRGQPEWAFPVLTFAALIKPQFAALAPLFALAFAARYLLPHLSRFRRGADPVEPLRASLERAATAIAASVAVLIVTVIPFGVGIPPFSARWSIFQRLDYALNTFNQASLNAFNLWALWGIPRPGVLVPDDHPAVFGLTYRAWGTILTVAAYLYILFRYWRRRDDNALIWACLAITFALFMLPTRVHERYLFPAIMFSALIAALNPRLWWLHALLSLSYLINLYYQLEWSYPLIRIDALYASNLVSHIVSLLNIELLLYVLARNLTPRPPSLKERGRSARLVPPSL